MRQRVIGRRMPDKSKKDIVVERMRESTAAFAKGVMPDKFKLPFSPNIHEPIFKIIDNRAIQQKGVAAPRGSGKSTTFCAYCAKKIAFQEKKNIIYISKTHATAVKRTETIKRVLEHNQLFRYLFGDLKGEKWAQDEWVTATGITVIPKGSDQQIRGELTTEMERPDLIVVDDLEDETRMKSEDYRKDISDWFYSSLVNMVDRSDPNWEIVVLGTILHEDSLLQNILDDPYWHTVRLELFDDNLKSMWPEQTSDEGIKELYDAYLQRGKLAQLYMELRNMVVTPDQTFKDSYFKYYDEIETKLDSDPGAETMVIVDPAKTVELHSDFSAIAGVAINPMKQALYIRDIVNERLHPDELYEKTFAMADRLHARVIGIEVTGLNEFILHPFKNYMMQRGGRMFEIIELKARGKKEERIAALVPYYRLGRVFHNKNVTAPLEAQLLSFPRSKYDDVMDAVAYSVEMLEKGERYFKTVTDSYEDPRAVEDEYKKLVDEPAFEWSRI